MNKIYSTRPTILKVCDSIQLGNITAPCITGQVGQVDEVSQNGYRYKKGFWDKILSQPQVQDSIKNREMLCTVEHPTDDNAYLRTPYLDASHIVVKAWVQDGNPFATLALLNNEKGNALKALIDVGHKPGVSTRGMGEILQDDISQYVSDEGYVLLGWDIVASPNFASLKMSPISDSVKESPIFKELCQMHGLADSSDTSYNKEKLLSDMAIAKAALQRMEAYLAQ